MPGKIDLEKFKTAAKLKGRYADQLQRLASAGIDPTCVQEAVENATTNLKANASSLVIYGEPQSGKTEMMICLTARLLDEGSPVIVHLLNDSVDLLTQNLKRFKASGLAPAAISSSELSQLPTSSKEIVVFCKKNARDLRKLIDWLKGRKKVVVVDDEADYASPNSKVNQGTRTKINNLVGELIGRDGYYVGVTATPARLDLNNTFQNDSDKWVNFPTHKKYTGQDVFFPLDKKVSYRLRLLEDGGSPDEAKDALARFLVSVAYLNTYENKDREKNYTMLVHTSGEKLAHEADRAMIRGVIEDLKDSESRAFEILVKRIHDAAQEIYPKADTDKLTEYVVKNASRTSLIVLNSERDRVAVGENATVPSSPFTIIIGGNIISRGVTLPNLLSMFFTRNVRSKLQQDTYIQRARMFGARGEYLEHFELAIPQDLYADWHRCFVFHRLALATITNRLGSPVWIGDNRISIASNASIDKATVALDKGEMSFGVFDYTPELDELVSENQQSVETLRKLQAKIGKDALPAFLIQFIDARLKDMPGPLAIHTASSIGGSSDADQAAISRDKGLMGKSQLEPKKFPDAIHHIKVFYNRKRKARLFYKLQGSLQFVQNLKTSRRPEPANQT